MREHERFGASEPDDDIFDAERIERAPGSIPMFGDETEFNSTWAEWEGMPEYIQHDLRPVASILVHFRSLDDLNDFARTIGQSITWPTTRGIWYPKVQMRTFIDKRWRDEDGEPVGDDVPGSFRITS